MKTLLVPRHSVTMKDFSAFLDRRRDKNWAHKINSWGHLTIWRPVLPVPHWAQSASFLLSTLNSFRGCWRSAAAAAHDSILMEVDDKHPWEGPVCSWHYKYSRDALIEEHTSVGWETWLQPRLDIRLEVLPMVQQDCVQEDCVFGSRYKGTSIFQHGVYIFWHVGWGGICHFIKL